MARLPRVCGVFYIFDHTEKHIHLSCKEAEDPFGIFLERGFGGSPVIQNYMNQKIRVLECIRQGKIGGGESHLLNLVEYLDKDRFEPVVLSFTQGPMIDRLQEMGVGTDVIYTEKPFDVTKWGKVKGLLKEKKVDLIHAHGTRAASNVLWAARSLGIPVVYTIHGWSFHQDQRTL